MNGWVCSGQNNGGDVLVMTTASRMQGYKWDRIRGSGPPCRHEGKWSPCCHDEEGWFGLVWINLASVSDL